MAKDTLPTMRQLEQPIKGDQLLREEQRAISNDCMACRVLGSGAFIGLGVYSYASGMATLHKQQEIITKSRSIFGMKSRQAALTGTSLGLIGLGIYRLLN